MRTTGIVRDLLSRHGERFFIAAAATAYLIAFTRSVQHGDALRIVRQIEAAQLSWNPNHLVFDLLGYGWYWLLRTLGLDITPLSSFEIISVISTVISLLLFHAILRRLGVAHGGVRLLLVAGLFASRSFLSLANSQYYFMVQMPFLLGSMYLFICFFDSGEHEPAPHPEFLYGAAVLAAIAGTILFSNVLLVAILGLVAGLGRGLAGSRRLCWHTTDAARFWGMAAMVGFPTYVVGYLASGSTAGFIGWLVSYQGESSSALTELYRVQLDVHGVAESVARVGFNLLLANILENAGLGSVLQTLLFRQNTEFLFDPGRLIPVLVLTPFVVGMVSYTYIRSLPRIGRDSRILLLYAWTLAYLLFNFVWSVGNDLFWVQAAPVTWLLLARLHFHGLADRVPVTSPATWFGIERVNLVLAMLVFTLLIANTMNTVLPLARSYDHEVRAYHALLRNGDLEIMPGWEAAEWTRTTNAGPNVHRLQLYNMALQPKSSPMHISRLPEVISERMASGQRIVIGRLYDKDFLINPWNKLERLGWPRVRIQSLLENYCHPVLGEIDGVVFREIQDCHRDK